MLADKTTLIPSFTLSPGAAASINSEVQVSGSTSNDYSNPVTMTVTAEDAITTQNWTVIVTFAIPTIMSISPSSGPIGTTVTITGSNFNSMPSENIVYFGATRANILTGTTTELTVSVPVGATFEPISVLSNGLIGYSTTPFSVTFGGTEIDVNSFEEKVDFSAMGAAAASSSVADFDGDGKVDFATVNSGN